MELQAISEVFLYGSSSRDPGRAHSLTTIRGSETEKALV